MPIVDLRPFVDLVTKKLDIIRFTLYVRLFLQFTQRAKCIFLYVLLSEKFRIF